MKINYKIVRNIALQGFTVIELMVTMAIFTLITSVVLYQNSGFNSTVLLTDLAYQGALSLRQAQVYGLSSKQLVGSSGGSLGYGVHFAAGTASLDDHIHYTLFADANGNSVYNSGESVTTTTIGQNDHVQKICFYRSGAWDCANNVTETTIIFKRPNTEPFIGDSSGSANGIDRVQIVFSPINDATLKRCVIVNRAGQIAVQGPTGCQ